MTTRPTSLRYPEGTKSVGTATVCESSFAAREIERRTGNAPVTEPDAFDQITLPEPVFTRTIAFTVPGVPVPKGRPRAFRSPTGIRMHTPKETKTYERTVKAAAAEAMHGTMPFGRPVSVTLSIVLPIPPSWSGKRQTKARIGIIAATNKPDADNVLKAIKDAMNGVVYEDDAQVVSITLTKAYGDVPRVDVGVAELDKEAA